MSKKNYHTGVRFTEGVDVWTCDKCGNVNIMGRNMGICSNCGRDYVDVLKAKETPKTQRKHESADPWKLRLPEGNWTTSPQPVKEGGICQSFLKIKQSQEKKK